MNNVHKSSKQYKLSGKFHDHDKTLGSLFLLQEANCDPSVPKAACAMLGYILERYISKEGNAWTTDDMVTDVTGVKRGAVMRNRKILKKEGYVKVVKIGRRGSIGKPGTGTVYKPIFDKGWAPKLAQDAARIAANEIKQNENTVSQMIPQLIPTTFRPPQTMKNTVSQMIPPLPYLYLFTN